ncbi:Uncharacterised protein [Canicola haemoglobinophilus]|nr:Uncharacterised protein [Canicola haemoglobinophilus]
MKREKLQQLLTKLIQQPKDVSGLSLNIITILIYCLLIKHFI